MTPTTALQRYWRGRMPIPPPAGLDPLEASLLYHHAELGLTYTEIARRTGRSIDWVREHCYRASLALGASAAVVDRGVPIGATGDGKETPECLA